VKIRIATTLLLVLVGARVLLEVVYGLPSFDGVLNLQMAVNLAREGSYATSYCGPTPFDPNVQTGPGAASPQEPDQSRAVSGRAPGPAARRR